MPRGRPSIPDEVKILRGTFRDERVQGSRVQAEGEPEMPEHLEGDAQKHWMEVVPQLVAMGLAKRCDASLLAGMCEWWAMYRQLMVMAMDGTDDWRARRQCMNAWNCYCKVAKKFGLNPQDRLRLIVPAKKSEGVASRPREAQ